jgi:hypothetical protein
VEFIIAKAKLLDRLRGQINERQQNALLRVFREGPEGFDGGLSAGNYSTIAQLLEPPPRQRPAIWLIWWRRGRSSAQASASTHAMR